MKPWEKYAATPGPWQKYAQPTLAPETTEEPGMLESGLRGVEQGLTLGFGDEINAALSTLLDTMSGRNKDLSIIDDYTKQRDESRAAFKAAEEAHPYISGAGNIAGGLAPALLTAGVSLPAQGLAGAAKLGIGYGALGGLGMSEADLTKGDLAGAGKDVALGSALGGLLGAGAHGAVDALGSTLKKAGGTLGGAAKSVASTPFELPIIEEPIQSFTKGLGGQKLYGKGREDIQQKFIDVAETLPNDLAAATNIAGESKKAVLKQADKIDMNPWISGYKKILEGAKANLTAKPAAEAEIKQVQNFINRWRLSDKKGARIGKLDKNKFAKAADVEDLKANLQNWTSASDDAFKTKEARAFVLQLVQDLEASPSNIIEQLNVPKNWTGAQSILAGKEIPGALAPGNIQGGIPGVGPLNERLHALLEAKKVLPNLNEIMNVEKVSQSGTTAKQAMKNFLDVAPEDVVKTSADKIFDLAGSMDIANKIAAPGLSHGYLANSVRGTLLTGANMAGLAGRGLYDMTPDAIKSLASTLATKATPIAKKLSTILSQASQKDNIGRNALFFAIQQNPEYRKIINEATGGQIAGVNNEKPK